MRRTELQTAGMALARDLFKLTLFGDQVRQVFQLPQKFEVFIDKGSRCKGFPALRDLF